MVNHFKTKHFEVIYRGVHGVHSARRKLTSEQYVLPERKQDNRLGEEQSNGHLHSLMLPAWWRLQSAISSTK